MGITHTHPAMTAGRLINKPLPSIHTNTGAFATAYRCWNNVSTNTVNSQPSSPDVQSGQLALLSWTTDTLDVSISDFKIATPSFNLLPRSLDSSPTPRRKSDGDLPLGSQLCRSRQRKSRSRVDGAHVHVHGDRTPGHAMHADIELGKVDFVDL